MPAYDILKIDAKIQKGGGTMPVSFNRPSVGFKRPTSQFEANKMAEEWLLKKYPGCKILSLNVTIG